MSVTKIEDEKIKELKTTYELDDLQIIDLNNIISVLVKTNSNILHNNWTKLNSMLSELLDEYLDSSFKKWNVYILYITIDKVSKELKYKIENNTFFARKIVEDSYTFELADENIEKLIAEHIDFTGLAINLVQPKNEPYESTSEIYMKLKEIDIINEAQIDEILKSLEWTSNEI